MVKGPTPPPRNDPYSAGRRSTHWEPLVGGYLRGGGTVEEPTPFPFRDDTPPPRGPYGGRVRRGVTIEGQPGLVMKGVQPSDALKGAGRQKLGLVRVHMYICTCGGPFPTPLPSPPPPLRSPGPAARNHPTDPWPPSCR